MPRMLTPPAVCRTRLLRNDDALHDRPRRAAALVARREDDRIAGLIGDPEVLEDVAFDQHVLRVLQLEGVLHRPLRPAVARLLGGRRAADRGAGSAVSMKNGGVVFQYIVLPAGRAAVDEVVLGAGHRRPRDAHAAGRPGGDRRRHFGRRRRRRLVRSGPTSARAATGRSRCRPRAHPPAAAVRPTRRRRRDDRIAPRRAASRRWLWRNVMSVVTRFGIVGSDPPNSTFSVAPSR